MLYATQTLLLATTQNVGGCRIAQELLEELDVVKQNFTGFFSALRPKIESMHTTTGTSSGGAGDSPGTGSQSVGADF